MRSRRKASTLPDLRSSSYTYPEDADEKGRQWSLPSSAQFNALATKHGFKVAGSAAANLKDIAFWWRYNLAARNEPTGKIRQEFMTELVTRAADLKEAIGKLGDTEERGIYDAAESFHAGDRLDLEVLQKDLSILEEAANAHRAN